MTMLCATMLWACYTIMPRIPQGEDVIRDSGVPFAVVRPTALTEEDAGAEVVVDQGDVLKVTITAQLALRRMQCGRSCLGCCASRLQPTEQLSMCMSAERTSLRRARLLGRTLRSWRLRCWRRQRQRTRPSRSNRRSHSQSHTRQTLLRRRAIGG
jgi:hypothetical protein